MAIRNSTNPVLPGELDTTEDFNDTVEYLENKSSSGEHPVKNVYNILKQTGDFDNEDRQFADRFTDATGVKNSVVTGNLLYDSVNFSVLSEDTEPQDFFFKPDGTKMYIMGNNNNSVFQYTLSTPWNVGTASYDNISFSVNSEDNEPINIFFKPDGLKMYVVGVQNASVHQYTLSTPWNVGTASYDNVSFSVASEDTGPTSMFFKPDGLKMYMVGIDNFIVYQYTLSTAWDVYTASYDNVSFSVAGQDTTITDIFFKPNGKKMYILGDDTNSVYQYTLSTAWDVDTASYDNFFFDISGQDTSPDGIFFKPDGLKMYFLGYHNKSVYQYTLSTNNWDLPSFSFYNDFSLKNESNSPKDISFSPDGTKMYMVGSDNDSVFQYTLSNPWDVGSASYDNVNFYLGNEDTTPKSVFFKPDGTKMYISGDTNNSVYQYTLSTPWDLDTTSYDNISFSISGQDIFPQSLFFKPDGLKMYFLGINNNSVYQYTLSTAWDLSTASYDNVNIYVGNEDTTPKSVFFKPDGTKMYILGDTNNSVYQYTLSTLWAVDTASYDNVSFLIENTPILLEGIFFKPDGSNFYVVWTYNAGTSEFRILYQYSLEYTDFTNATFNTNLYKCQGGAGNYNNSKITQDTAHLLTGNEEECYVFCKSNIPNNTSIKIRLFDSQNISDTIELDNEKKYVVVPIENLSSGNMILEVSLETTDNNVTPTIDGDSILII